MQSLHRRCQAYEELDVIDEAYKDAVVLNYLQPRNATIRSMMEKLEKKLKNERMAKKDQGEDFSISM